ncbi:MAG: YceI family protein [Sedimenticola sp.]
MNIRKSYLKGITFAVALFASIPLSFANEPNLCAPFKHNSLIDQSLVSSMLQAAERGDLYLVQPTISNFGFEVQSVIGRIEAEFTTFQGGISLQEPEDPAQGRTLVRVETDSLKTNGFLVRQMLKGSEFFDVRNFPEVFFASKELRRISPTEGVLEGDLTLRGITRHVVFRVDLSNLDAMTIKSTEVIKIKATTTIQRSEFGMDAFPDLAEDDVDLSIQVVAARYAN